jgi:hypothetical protein
MLLVDEGIDLQSAGKIVASGVSRQVMAAQEQGGGWLTTRQ